MPPLPEGHTDDPAAECAPYQVAACCPCGTRVRVSFEERSLEPAIHNETHFGLMVIAEELDATGAPTGLQVELPRAISRIHIDAGDVSWEAEFGYARDEALTRLAALKRARTLMAVLPLKRAEPASPLPLVP